MTNPYYAKVFDVVPGATNLSAPVEGEFLLIEQGFDALNAGLTGDLAAVYAAIDMKAPIASPAMTGTPTAPTPNTSDNSTRLATTAFTQAVLGAGGALLPPQAGHAGQALFTDGAVAAWASIVSSLSWAAISGKPTTLAGFGITNAQHAMEWLQDGRRVTTAPVRIDFENASVRRIGQDTVRVRLEAAIPHNLLIAAGVH